MNLTIKSDITSTDAARILTSNITQYIKSVIFTIPWCAPLLFHKYHHHFHQLYHLNNNFLCEYLIDMILKPHKYHRHLFLYFLDNYILQLHSYYRRNDIYFQYKMGISVTVIQLPFSVVLCHCLRITSPPSLSIF